ncbi:hypothetical protein [Stenotrophomonas sp.]|uniref:hypothetical protein n=1 Tax=Stenotrophomonas sp. TaxID=69392 RepID=UPI00289F463D|nr:hypothetical protein [Stenotrophomonas sp.]
MQIAEWLLRIGGLHCLAFAVFHLAFWRLFHWKHELAKLGTANRAIMQILNLRLVYVFLGMGLLSLAFTRELLDTRLGHVVLAFMALFWLGRSVEQLVFLRINDWRVHLLTALFVLGAVLYAVPLWLGFSLYINR